MSIDDAKVHPQETEWRIPRGPKGRIGPTLAIIRNPRKAFANWIAQYGDPFLVQALNGPIVITGRPDLIQEVFSEDPATFAPFAMPTLAPIVGSGSLLLLSGSQHKRERRLLTPMFHGERMRAYGADMHDIALEHGSRHATSQVIEAMPMMIAISLDVIIKTVFGSSSQSGHHRLLKAGTNLVRAANPLIFFSKKMHFSFLGISPWDRFCQARKELDAALDEELDARVSSGIHGEDILSLLASAVYDDGASITREHLRDELMTFLFAGHETSAIAMSWAIYHLHNDPRVLHLLQEELDQVDGSKSRDSAEVAQQLSQLPYLKAVVQETLRLHPIVTEVLRYLVKPMKLGEYHLPAGLSVAPAAGIAHYDASIYPEPDIFRPERFRERTYSPFEYMPFGGGARRCIGAAFASYEMAIVLGTLLKTFDFTLQEPKPVVPRRRNVTIGPSTGIRVAISRRAS